MSLSILICSLTTRHESFHNLLKRLSVQSADHPHKEDLEILFEIDSGKMSVGEKRNKLLQRANNKYVCFIDDDDLISPDYISLIMAAIRHEPDCVGFRLAYYEDGIEQGIAHHSIKYTEWATKKKDDKVFYERTPNHLNPIKHDIALRSKFPEVDHGEDHAWSAEIRQFLKTEVDIPEVIYFYKHITQK